MITDTLKAMAQSKKVLTAVAGVLTLIGVHFLSLPEDQLAPLSLQIAGVVATLLLGQGAADLGKEGKTREAEGVLHAIATEAAIREGFSPGDEDEDE